MTVSNSDIVSLVNSFCTKLVAGGAQGRFTAGVDSGFTEKESQALMAMSVGVVP